MIKILFTENYVGLIKSARELNRDNRISGDIYFHPREGSNDIIAKTTDLKLSNPMCEVNSRPGEDRKKKDCEESWIEAYLIREAKKNDWRICLARNEYKFLASQLTFRRRDKWKGTRKVDLLLYDEKGKSLVVLELKRDSESFDKASEELDIYVKELKRIFIEDADEKDGALKAYPDLESVKDVIGYVVCPRNEGNLSKCANNDRFGLYEFSCQYPIIENGKLVKPWVKYKTLEEELKLKELTITFDLTGEPTNEGI